MSDDPFTHLNTEGHPQERDTHKLEKGAVYLGGNVDTLRKVSAILVTKFSTLAITSTEIFPDRNEAKWRTALVVEELETEMQQSDHHQKTWNNCIGCGKKTDVDDLATCNENTGHD